MPEEVETPATASAPEATAAEPAVQETPAAPVDQEEQTAATDAESDIDGIAGEDEPEGKAEEAKAPQDYDFSELKPESEDYEIDQPTAQEFAKIAREVGLDQKGFATVFNKLMPYLNQRQEEHLNEVRRMFIGQAKADPVTGGAKWNETRTLARKALMKFTDGPTRELLRASGLDCHPGIIKAFYNIQKAMSDDVMVSGQQAAVKGDPAKAFFNNSNMN